MDWKRVVAVWDELCPARKGVKANISRYGDQRAVKGILASGVDEGVYREMIAAYLSEDWRDCYQLSALWSGWDAILAALTERKRKRALNLQSSGNPPTKIEEIRRVWAEPRLRAGDEAHQELVSWLRKQLREG